MSVKDVHKETQSPYSSASPVKVVFVMGVGRNIQMNGQRSNRNES